MLHLFSKLTNYAVVLFALVATCKVEAQSMNLRCAEHDGPWASTEMLSYLRSERAFLDQSCVRRAIIELGQAKYELAADVLASYLDFVDETETAVDPNTRLRRLLPQKKYPAMGALCEIGRPALPAILGIIKNGDSSELVRENALGALINIYGPDLQVAVESLAQAGRSSSNKNDADRFHDAAWSLSRWCDERTIAACEAAAQQK